MFKTLLRPHVTEVYPFGTRLSFSIRQKLLQGIVSTGIKNVEIGSLNTLKDPHCNQLVKDSSDYLKRNLAQEVSIHCSSTKDLNHFLQLRKSLEPSSLAVNTVILNLYAPVAFNAHDQATAFKNFQDIGMMAKLNHLKVKAQIHFAFVCPYEGQVSPTLVAYLTQRFKLQVGANTVVFTDLTGHCKPQNITDLLSEVLPIYPASNIGIQFSDSLLLKDNLKVCFQNNVYRFQTSLLGHRGIVSTDKMTYILRNEGFDMNIDDWLVSLSDELTELK
jgi:hypothetical protein